MSDLAGDSGRSGFPDIDNSFNQVCYSSRYRAVLQCQEVIDPSTRRLEKYVVHRAHRELVHRDFGDNVILRHSCPQQKILLVVAATPDATCSVIREALDSSTCGMPRVEID